MGYEVSEAYLPTAFPTEPVAPSEADCDTPEEYAEDMEKYQTDLAKYTEERDTIDSRLEKSLSKST